jgi:hypothetical protein
MKGSIDGLLISGLASASQPHSCIKKMNGYANIAKTPERRSGPLVADPESVSGMPFVYGH